MTRGSLNYSPIIAKSSCSHMVDITIKLDDPNPSVWRFLYRWTFLLRDLLPTLADGHPWRRKGRLGSIFLTVCAWTRNSWRSAQSLESFQALLTTLCSFTFESLLASRATSAGVGSTRTSKHTAIDESWQVVGLLPLFHIALDGQRWWVAGWSQIGESRC